MCTQLMVLYVYIYNIFICLERVYVCTQLTVLYVYI